MRPFLGCHALGAMLKRACFGPPKLCQKGARGFSYAWKATLQPRKQSSKMDTLGFEPRAFRMQSGCDAATPCARLLPAAHSSRGSNNRAPLRQSHATRKRAASIMPGLRDARHAWHAILTPRRQAAREAFSRARMQSHASRMKPCAEKEDAAQGPSHSNGLAFVGAAGSSGAPATPEPKLFDSRRKSHSDAPRWTCNAFAGSSAAGSPRSQMTQDRL